MRAFQARNLKGRAKGGGGGKKPSGRSKRGHLVKGKGRQKSKGLSLWLVFCFQKPVRSKCLAPTAKPRESVELKGLKNKTDFKGFRTKAPSNVRRTKRNWGGARTERTKLFFLN